MLVLKGQCHEKNHSFVTWIKCGPQAEGASDEPIYKNQFCIKAGNILLSDDLLYILQKLTDKKRVILSLS